MNERHRGDRGRHPRDEDDARWRGDAPGEDRPGHGSRGDQYPGGGQRARGGVPYGGYGGTSYGGSPYGDRYAGSYAGPTGGSYTGAPGGSYGRPWDEPPDRGRGAAEHAQAYQRRPEPGSPLRTYGGYESGQHPAVGGGYGHAGGYGGPPDDEGLRQPRQRPAGGPRGGRHEAQHHDPEYARWREEQMRALDEDYRQWRQERYERFCADFNEWRQRRQRGGPGASPNPTPDKDDDDPHST